MSQPNISLDSFSDEDSESAELLVPSDPSTIDETYSSESSSETEIVNMKQGSDVPIGDPIEFNMVSGPSTVNEEKLTESSSATETINVAPANDAAMIDSIELNFTESPSETITVSVTSANDNPNVGENVVSMEISDTNDTEESFYEDSGSETDYERLQEEMDIIERESKRRRYESSEEEEVIDVFESDTKCEKFESAESSTQRVSIFGHSY